MPVLSFLPSAKEHFRHVDTNQQPEHTHSKVCKILSATNSTNIANDTTWNKSLFLYTEMAY
jgi:hypothetical protein